MPVIQENTTQKRARLNTSAYKLFYLLKSCVDDSDGALAELWEDLTNLDTKVLNILKSMNYAVDISIDDSSFDVNKVIFLCADAFKELTSELNAIETIAPTNTITVYLNTIQNRYLKEHMPFTASSDRLDSSKIFVMLEGNKYRVLTRFYDLTYNLDRITKADARTAWSNSQVIIAIAKKSFANNSIYGYGTLLIPGENVDGNFDEIADKLTEDMGQLWYANM